MNDIKTISLSKVKSYVRPKYTIQDKLTEEEIEEKLEDYIEVDDISKIPLRTHIRYFITTIDKNGSSIRKFRLGGILIDKDHAETYIRLSNGNLTWSVQVNNATFYRKLTIEEIKEEYNSLIQEQAEEIKFLKKQIKKLKNKLTNNNFN